TIALPGPGEPARAGAAERRARRRPPPAAVPAALPGGRRGQRLFPPQLPGAANAHAPLVHLLPLRRLLPDAAAHRLQLPELGAAAHDQLLRPPRRAPVRGAGVPGAAAQPGAVPRRAAGRLLLPAGAELLVR